MIETRGIPRNGYKQFKKLNPPDFKGELDPIKADNWLSEMEKIFRIHQCEPNQRVPYATYMLKEEAHHWWRAIEGSLDGSMDESNTLPWAEFKKIFEDQYLPRGMKDKLELDFMERKQNQLTVSQYAAKFNELARFAPHVIKEESRKARRFEQGLKPAIRSRLTAFQLQKYAEVVEKALLVERDYEEWWKEKEEKKKKRGEGPGERKPGDPRSRRGEWDQKGQGMEGKVEVVEKGTMGEAVSTHLGPASTAGNRVIIARIAPSRSGPVTIAASQDMWRGFAPLGEDRQNARRRRHQRERRHAPSRCPSRTPKLPMTWCQVHSSYAKNSHMFYLTPVPRIPLSRMVSRKTCLSCPNPWKAI